MSLARRFRIRPARVVIGVVSGLGLADSAFYD